MGCAVVAAGRLERYRVSTCRHTAGRLCLGVVKMLPADGTLSPAGSERGQVNSASCRLRTPQSAEGGSSGPKRPRYSSAGYFRSFLAILSDSVAETSIPSSLAMASP